MRVAIMGTGGTGGYFGGLLAKAGHDVTFIARGQHLDAIRRNGLRVESVHGDFIVSPATATDNPGEIGIVDLVLFTVKTWQIEEAAEAIRPLVGQETAVLPVQNGVDSSERLIAILSEQPVLGGAAYIVSFVAGPGVIRQNSAFRKITLGEINRPVSTRVQAIGGALAEAGVEVEVTDNINQARWSKFIFIAAFSGVGAVTRVPAGALMACSEAVLMLEEAIQEIEALGRAKSVQLDSDIVEETLQFCRSLAPDATASMQRDIMDGRPSELESQNGFISREGAKLGIPVPVNTFIYRALLPQERQARVR